VDKSKQKYVQNTVNIKINDLLIFSSIYLL
jgi:hypothetical protein